MLSLNRLLTLVVAVVAAVSTPALAQDNGSGDQLIAATRTPAPTATPDALSDRATQLVERLGIYETEILGMSLEEGYERQELIGRELRKTDDAREAQRAFVEKRPPVWRGR